MNKRILISLSVIAAVAAIAIGGTIAYFSDTETSTGNTFTAGSLDLTVTSEGEAVGASCTFADAEGEAIIACSDVKPGDSGESTVHFTLEDNPAWACVAVNNVVDDDNTCTEPEDDAEANCAPGNDGELDENLLLTIWVDNGIPGQGEEIIGKCNNEYEEGEEKLATDVPLSEFMNGGSSFLLPVSDSSGDSMMDEPLQPGEHCLGIEWEVSSDTGNDVQSDKLSGDLLFYVEQFRNNSGFTCANWAY